MNLKAPKRFDAVLAFDVELTMREDNPNLDDFKPEIVEFGYVLFDLTHRSVVDSGEVFIKPVKTVVGPMLTALTGREKFPRGMPAADAISHLRKTGLGQYVSVSYGLDRLFMEEFAPNLLSNAWVDVAALTTTVYRKRISLENAYINLYGAPYDGTPHRAIDDALMLARVYGSLL